MRFLIVDDDVRKIVSIRGFLNSRNINDSSIVIAEDAAAARVELAKSAVDVLFIDVLLPVRSGAQPNGENSLELLRQIVEDGTSPAPKYIYAMTASHEALAEYEEEFRSLVTQVLLVEPGRSEWQGPLGNLLQFLERTKVHQTNDYDICVLNALRVPELEAVYDLWPLDLGGESLLCRNVAYRTGTLRLNGIEKRIVCASLPQMGPVSATHAATVLLQEFRPRVLVMTGICGGFADKVGIGDLIVAEKSWDWQAGKWNGKGVLATAPDQRDGSAELVALSHDVGAFLSAAHADYKEKRPESPPKVVVGPMVTGSAVIASPEVQEVFREQHRKMVGVDMECYGLYYAAEHHAGSQVKVLCAKAVSDLADQEKGDDYQRYCAFISAVGVLEILGRYFQKKLGR